MFVRPWRLRQIRGLLKIVVPLALFTSGILFYILRQQLEVFIPGDVDISKYGPFEPDVFTDFNYGTNDRPKIQRIIHQTWKNDKIPPQFVKNVQSFVTNNPSWQYYLWTDESARHLIKDYYPWLLPVWDGIQYSKFTIRRADALRYVVLHHYGGIYADLDAINFRSLENSIMKHPCVFTPEPFEHAVTRAWVPYLINNAVMMCSANHPFLKQLISNLHTTEHFDGIIDATGPGYVTIQYKLYNNLPRERDQLVLYNNRNIADLGDNSPYFNKGNTSMSNGSSVYIANTRYFIHSLDINAYGHLYRQCKHFKSLNHLQKRSCVNAKRLGLVRTVSEFAFVDHQWTLSWFGWKKMFKWFYFRNGDENVPIKRIVPHCNIYKSKTADQKTKHV